MGVGIDGYKSILVKGARTANVLHVDVVVRFSDLPAHSIPAPDDLHRVALERGLPTAPTGGRQGAPCE